MLDPISILVGAILGGAIVAYPALRAVNRMAGASAAAIKQCNEMLAVLKPLLREVIEYRRAEAERDEFVEWPETIEVDR